MNRRYFFEKLGRLTGAVSTGLFFSSALKSGEEPSLPDAVIAKGSPDEILHRIFKELGGPEQFISPGNVVLIKPNIAFASPAEWGATTSPELIKSLAEICLGAGARRVIVADHTTHDAEKCFERTGIREALAGLEKVSLMALDQENMYIEKKVPYGKAIRSVKIARLIEKTDVLINLPCAKSHSGTDVSFGLKNLMGLIWDRAFFHSSTDLHAAIAELSMVIHPQLTILDASRALVTNGPTGPGKVEKLNTLIAGTRPLAVDACAASLAQWNNRSVLAESVRHLAHASHIGLGEIDMSKLNILRTG
jgi:uncharacterized protein (DUF362 family)